MLLRMHVHVVSDCERILCHVHRLFFLCHHFYCCFSCGCYFSTYSRTFNSATTTLKCVMLMYACSISYFSSRYFASNVIKFQNQIVHLCCSGLSFQRQLKIITMICVMQIYIYQITSSGCISSETSPQQANDRVTEKCYFLHITL